MANKKTDSPKKDRAKNHEPDEEPSFNTVLGPEEEGADAKRKGISRPSAVLLALLATLAGGAIGWGGPALFGNSGAKTAALQSALDQTKAELSQATKDREALSARLDQLQTDARAKGSASKNVNQMLTVLQADLDQLKTRPEPTDFSDEITALNERISTLTAIPVNEDKTANLEALMERLDTLEQQGSEGGGGISERLEALETEINTLSTNAAEAVFPEPDTTPIEIPAMETAQDQEDALQVLIDSFPRDKMLEAVKAQEILANKKPSWLQRMLSRHVKVRDDDQPVPANVIDDAEAALKNGNVSEAVRLVNTLNPPVKTVAADWITAAKKAAKQIEKDL